MRIIYLSWSAHEISGGIKLAYRHVETLRAANIEAAIATPDGASPTWFATNAPTLTLSELRTDTDILVFPENHAQYLQQFFHWTNPKVVFCQNQFMAYRGLNGANCYSDFGVTELLAEGRHVVDFCERRFKNLRIHSVPIYVDTKLFSPNPQKKIQIAYAPRKRPQEAEVIKDLFRAENLQFRDVPWVAIQDKSEQQVAQILGQSAIYLSLCRFEAFPLSILEALASGCIVAGFTGLGGRLYTTSRNGFWVAEDDCFDCATQLARAARMVTVPDDALVDMINSAVGDARRINREHFDNRVVGYWKHFLERHRR